MNWTFLMQISFAIWFFVIHFIPLPSLNDISQFPNNTFWKIFLFGHLNTGWFPYLFGWPKGP